MFFSLKPGGACICLKLSSTLVQTQYFSGKMAANSKEDRHGSRPWQEGPTGFQLLRHPLICYWTVILQHHLAPRQSRHSSSLPHEMGNCCYCCRAKGTTRGGLQQQWCQYNCRGSKRVAQCYPGSGIGCRRQGDWSGGRCALLGDQGRPVMVGGLSGLLHWCQQSTNDSQLLLQLMVQWKLHPSPWYWVMHSVTGVSGGDFEGAVRPFLPAQLQPGHEVVYALAWCPRHSEGLKPAVPGVNIHGNGQGVQTGLTRSSSSSCGRGHNTKGGVRCVIWNLWHNSSHCVCRSLW